MVEKRKRESGKRYCAAGSRNAVNCSNKSDIPGVTMHYFPSDKSLWQKYIHFVRIHRKDFIPSKSSASVLLTSMTVAFTSRESLCLMTVEKQICPGGT